MSDDMAGTFRGDGSIDELNGRYDQEAGSVLAYCEAESVLLIVMKGKNGSGCTLLTKDRSQMLGFAELMEMIASQLRSDVAAMDAPNARH